MVFSSTTFLFLFLPAVFFFYWLPDVCAKIKSFFCSKKLDNAIENTAEYSQQPTANSQQPTANSQQPTANSQQPTANAYSSAILADSSRTEDKQIQPWRHYKNLVLLAFSILFYAWGEPIFVLVMLLSIFVNYTFGRLLGKYRKHDKKILWASVAFNIGILFIFKYLCFTLQNIGWLINIDFSNIKIALPIGISFFTFQAMSYVIDVYSKKVEVQKSLFNLGLYIALFPQLVAGPIVRYETVAQEIENRNENYDDFAEGTIRFIQGLAKKVIIANQVALVADAAFETPIEELSTAFAWLGAIAYTLQIYFDFSGYSDMAIGLGRMFGFHFLENFNYPYMASSITDFWRRWHISLSSWFRDYVYFPLGGSRVPSRARHIFNLFAVWALTGIWHGANWTFIIWGLFYFLLLVVEKLLNLEKNKSWFGHIYTLFFVTIGWVFFRADTIYHAIEYTKIILGAGLSNATLDFFIYTYLVLLLALYCSNQSFILIFEKISPKPLKIIYIIFIWFISLAMIISSEYNPFIYFNF